MIKDYVMCNSSDELAKLKEEERIESLEGRGLLFGQEVYVNTGTGRIIAKVVELDPHSQFDVKVSTRLRSWWTESNFVTPCDSYCAYDDIAQE